MLKRLLPDISSKYGGKLGFLNHCHSFAAYKLGQFERYCRIDWHRVERFIFICAGNICRSPYAEAKAKTLGVPVASFGLNATAGTRASPQALAIAAGRGIDLAGHKAKTADEVPLKKSDLLIGMEPSHVADLTHFTQIDLQLTLLGLWATPIRVHIQDPYGRSDCYFRTCYDLIDTAIVAILENYSRPFRSCHTI